MSINKNEKKTGAAGDQRSSQPPEADNDIHLLHWLEEELGKALDIHEFSNLKYGKVGYTLASYANQKHVVGLNLDEIKLSPTSALIRRFHHLQILSLSECELTNIFFIEGMRHLTYLDLSWNPIKDHTFLQGLNSLTHLNLSYNEITDISFLQGLSNLTHLYLSGNKLTDISFLQGLSQLTELHLGGNQITDISFLQGLSNLKTLDISQNKINQLPEAFMQWGVEIRCE